MAATEDEQELSITHVCESNDEISSCTEQLETTTEGTPPYTMVGDVYTMEDVTFPYDDDYLTLEKGGSLFIAQPDPHSTDAPPVLHPEQEWESSSNQLGNDSFQTNVWNLGAAFPWLPNVRVLLVFVAVSCSLAVAAWLAYRQLTWTPRRFAEMRADQTDPIVADYTEPSLPDERGARAGDPGVLPNVTFDDLRLLGAWRRASGSARDSRVR
ncbi:hypothetical protein MRX96_019759 [Rhipicephalus microplus]